MLQLGMLHPERLIAFPRSHRLGDAGTTPDPVPFAFQTELLLQGWASSSVQREDPARTVLSEVPYRPEKFMFVIHSEKLVQSLLSCRTNVGNPKLRYGVGRSPWVLGLLEMPPPTITQPRAALDLRPAVIGTCLANAHPFTFCPELHSFHTLLCHQVLKTHIYFLPPCLKNIPCLFYVEIVL